MASARSHPYPLVGLLELTGREKAVNFLKSLGQQRLRPVEGYTHMANLLAAGEFPLAIFAQVSKLEPMKKKGAPLDWKATAPTFATVSAVGVTRNSSRPAAARLLVEFYLSVEGQQAMAKTGKIPVRRGIKTSSTELDQLLESEQIQVLKEEGDYGNYMKVFQESLGLS
jgi:ABC-type Fe3+ transport system substrate-binding protein